MNSGKLVLAIIITFLGYAQANQSKNMDFFFNFDQDYFNV